MAFIIDAVNDSAMSPEEIKDLYNRYYRYLDSIRAQMPGSAFNIAIAPWHYDHEDPRCPHDAWVVSVVIEELSYESNLQVREIQIRVRLLNAFHNGYIELRYEKVKL